MNSYDVTVVSLNFTPLESIRDVMTFLTRFLTFKSLRFSFRKIVISFIFEPIRFFVKKNLMRFFWKNRIGLVIHRSGRWDYSGSYSDWSVVQFKLQLTMHYGKMGSRVRILSCYRVAFLPARTTTGDYFIPRSLFKTYLSWYTPRLLEPRLRPK